MGRHLQVVSGHPLNLRAVRMDAPHNYRHTTSGRVSIGEGCKGRKAECVV